MARVRYGSFLKPILHYKVGTFTTQLISRCSLFNLCKSEGFFYCIYKSKSGNCEALQNGPSSYHLLIWLPNLKGSFSRIFFLIFTMSSYLLLFLLLVICTMCKYVHTCWAKLYNFINQINFAFVIKVHSFCKQFRTRILFS